jgi:hypothetical protein
MTYLHYYYRHYLRQAAANVLHLTGIDPKKFTTYSLLWWCDCPSGHQSQYNPICFIGQWQPDAMLSYLQVQALTRTRNHAKSMLDFGNFTSLSMSEDANPNSAFPL